MTSTQAGPYASSAAPSSAAGADSGNPDNQPASCRFGVITVATGSSSASRVTRASSSTSGSPCLLIPTGSTTTGTVPSSPATSSATVETISAVPSIPILTASTPMSSTTLRNCCRTASMGSGQMPWTPTEFCAVIAVITLMPCPP